MALPVTGSVRSPSLPPQGVTTQTTESADLASRVGQVVQTHLAASGSGHSPRTNLARRMEPTEMKGSPDEAPSMQTSSTDQCAQVERTAEEIQQEKDEIARDVVQVFESLTQEHKSLFAKTIWISAVDSDDEDIIEPLDNPNNIVFDNIRGLDQENLEFLRLMVKLSDKELQMLNISEQYMMRNWIFPGLDSVQKLEKIIKAFHGVYEYIQKKVPEKRGYDAHFTMLLHIANMTFNVNKMFGLAKDAMEYSLTYFYEKNRERLFEQGWDHVNSYIKARKPSFGPSRIHPSLRERPEVGHSYHQLSRRRY